MIAIDTSTLQRLFAGEVGEDIGSAIRAFESGEAVLPPAVLTETLSDPQTSERLTTIVLAVPLLHVADGYWERAGWLRADLKRGGFKANVADVLIAQSCIDHDIPLITYDRDFRHFVKAGLKLA